MNKILKIISALALCVCLICLAVFTGCTKNKGLTKEYFEENTTEVLKKSVDYETLFGEMDGLWDFINSRNAGFVCEMDLTPLVGFDMKLLLDAVTSEKDGGTIEVLLSGGEENSLDLGIYFDRDGLYLSSKALTTEDKAYGIKFDSVENIAKKFDSSNLAKILGLPENSAKNFFEENGIDDEYIKNVSSAYKKYVQISESYTLDYIYDKLLCAYEPYYGNIKSETVDVNGTKTEVLTLSMDVNKQMLEACIDAYIGLYTGILDAQNEFYTAVVPGSMRETVLPVITASSENIASLFDEMKNSVEKISGTTNISISKETGLAVMVKSKADIVTYGETISVDVTEYIGDDITYEGTLTQNGETKKLSGKLYRDDSENRTKLALDMTIGEGEDATNLEVGIKTEKAEKSYEFYVKDTESLTDISVKGGYEITDTVFAFTVDNIYGAGEETNPGIKYRIDLNKKPEMPAEKEDLLELSEDGVYALIGRISSSAQKLSGMFEGEEPQPELDYVPQAQYAPLSYDDYELYSEYYTYEEFCDFADIYNMAIAG